MEVLLSHLQLTVYVNPILTKKKVHFKAKMNLFLTFKLLNFFLWMLQCAETFFIDENKKKIPKKYATLAKFQKFSDN